jgi:flagellum-specific ATP synthase
MQDSSVDVVEARKMPGCGSLRTLARELETRGSARSAISLFGRVIAIDAGGIRIAGLSRFARIGDFFRLSDGGRFCLAEAISVNATTVVVKPFGTNGQAQIDMPVEYLGEFTVQPDSGWIGRTLSAFAEPIDDLGPLPLGLEKRSLHSEPPKATQRTVVGTSVLTGVRAVDIFTPLCLGQRIGIFAGSGVGKSTLLAMLARTPGFDVAVIALIGERGREVNEFIQDVLGEALKKSVVIVSTGDEAAGLRKTAPLLATCVAEYFRDQGKQVLLVMDSVTRYAMAAREIAMAGGEMPVARGYPPSVFSDLQQLLERAGPGGVNQGSITGIYAVLIDGDNHSEPLGDAVRGILDGHIVLDRDIANSGRFPAVDVLASVSRLAGKALQPSDAKLALEARSMISKYESTKDLRLLGGYQPGNDRELDAAIEITPKIYGFLVQNSHSGPDREVFSGLSQVIKPVRANQAAASSRPTS